MENPYCKYNAKNWLEDNPMSYDQRKEMFPGLTPDACANIQGGIAKSGNYDQVTYDNQIQSYIAENGLPCWFYPYLFQEEKMEEFTGEHNSAGYGRPVEVLMVLEIKDTPSWVSGLGIENDDTVTAWLHIRDFKEKIYPILDNASDERHYDYKTIYDKNPWLTKSYLKKIQPKPKDCFQILTIGCDREWDRGAKIWEITNVEDELISEKLNPAMGHYVWKITAKRYRYSFEYGMSRLDEISKDNPLLGQMGELGNHQVYENEVVRKFLAGVQLVTEDTIEEMQCEESTDNLILEDGVFTEITQKFDKGYSQAEVCDDAKKEVFDMERHDTEIYSHVDSGGFF
jgi:hypothetical protein